MPLTLTRDSVHAGDDADAPHEQHLDLPDDAVLRDLVDWVMVNPYLPTAGMGGTWVLVLGRRRGGRLPALPGRPAAAIAWLTYEPRTAVFILSADTPLAGVAWADLDHHHRGSAQEVAERYGAESD